MINIRDLYLSPNGTRELIEFTFDKKEFRDLNFIKNIIVQATLIRVEEGIMLIIDELLSEIKSICVRCGKDMFSEIELSESEWLFYDKEPKNYDDENEFLFIDMNEMEINPFEAIRQELLLNAPAAPHCKNDCVKFDNDHTGVKALAGLKSMFNSEDSNQ